MKGSGPTFSKPRSSKAISKPQAPIMAPVPETPTIFPSFLELPQGIQETILKKGLPMSGLRPSQQLELAATTVPSVALSTEFLLPTTITTQSLEGYTVKSEEKHFKTSIEIKDFLNDLFKNADTKHLDTLILQNDYIEVRIVYYTRSMDGRITIAVFVPGTTVHMASITFNFVRVKKQYDTIMLSKIMLQIHLYKNTDLDYLKELFIGTRWLFLIFKKITWDKNTVIFENPNNISIYVNNQAVALKDVDQEVVQKTLLLLRYMEISLKSKRKTTRNTKQ